MSYIKHKYLSEFRVSLLTRKAPRFSVRLSNNRRRGRRNDDKEDEEDDIQSLLHRLMPLLRWSDQTWSANQHADTPLPDGGRCLWSSDHWPSVGRPRCRVGQPQTGTSYAEGTAWSKQTYVYIYMYVSEFMYVRTYIHRFSFSLSHTHTAYVRGNLRRPVLPRETRIPRSQAKEEASTGLLNEQNKSFRKSKQTGFH